MPYLGNEIRLTDWLVTRYNMLMSLYARGSQFDKTTDINNPYWHLQGDGFWHLQGRDSLDNVKDTPSRAWLKANIDYARVDDDLWLLLQNRTMRERLRNYIILHKLDGTDRNRGMMAAEGLGSLAALLLSVA